MQRITRLARIGNTNTIQRSGNYLNKTQIRRVSQQCWDVFGFLKDGTDFGKRDSSAWIFWHHGWLWKPAIFIFQFVPATFVLWSNGVFDYMFRRRLIKPLEPDFDAEYPYRPKDPNYQNPLFEPGRRYAEKRAKKKAEKERLAAAKAGN